MSHNTRLIQAEKLIDELLEYCLEYRGTRHEAVRRQNPTVFLPAAIKQAKAFLGETTRHQPEPAKRNRVQMHPVVSSFITHIGFDPKMNDLYIYMDSGNYVYHNVPSHIYNRFISADSHGLFYTTQIKGYYECDPI